jgi:hypothetical protein
VRIVSWDCHQAHIGVEKEEEPRRGENQNMESTKPARGESRYPFLLATRFHYLCVAKSMTYGHHGILLDKSVLLQMDTFGVEL